LTYMSPPHTSVTSLSARGAILQGQVEGYKNVHSIHHDDQDVIQVNVQYNTQKISNYKKPATHTSSTRYTTRHNRKLSIHTSIHTYSYKTSSSVIDKAYELQILTD
jgi:hypothetical protein